MDSQTHISENFCQGLVGTNLRRILNIWYRGIPIRYGLLARNHTLDNHFIIVKELIASKDFHLRDEVHHLHEGGGADAQRISHVIDQTRMALLIHTVHVLFTQEGGIFHDLLGVECIIGT